MRRKFIKGWPVSLGVYCAIYISGRASGYLMLSRGKLYAGTWAQEPGQWFGRERNKLFNASDISTAPLLPLAALEFLVSGRDGIGKTKTSDVHIRQRLSEATLMTFSRKLPDGLQPIEGFFETRWDQDRESVEWLMRVPAGSVIQEKLPQMAAELFSDQWPLSKLGPQGKATVFGDYTFGSEALSCGAVDDGGRSCKFIFDPQQQLLYFRRIRDGY